ncbi:uncharacterized protein LOC124171891 [Ischnura elegans]|uniref:uncharacterized protein LOC124171891 n=1 Tax=Ischnura elegans TaxID=197161 RepID=UPI001ED88E66|nr:uncharacterized protein LOC124171891 [Ischnura elegans]XP_046407239.1 uncharacterized protein LOC124171891 [Ischnura elegans]
MPWVVAEFFPHREFLEATVQTIPESWVCRHSSQTYALYPPETFPAPVVQQMIRKQHSPNKSWEKIKLKFVTTPFDDVLAATHLEIEAADCEDSDLERFVMMKKGATKRKRKMKDLHYPNEPWTESDQSDVDTISNPPSPSAVKSCDFPLEVPPVPKPRTSLGGGGVRDTAKRCNKQVESSMSREAVDSDIAAAMKTNNVSLSAEIKSFIQHEIAEMKKEIKRQMREDKAEVLEAINAVTFQLKSARIGSIADSFPPEMESRHCLPMDTLEELIEFEGEIASDKEYRRFLVKHLMERSSNLLYRSITEKLFSAAVNKTVNDICSMIMSNDMGKQFCMKGRTPHKIPFESTFPNTIDLIFDSVKTKGANGPQLDLFTVKKSIGEWLRLARLRGGSKKSVTSEIV